MIIYETFGKEILSAAITGGLKKMCGFIKSGGDSGGSPGPYTQKPPIPPRTGQHTGLPGEPGQFHLWPGIGQGS